MQLAMKESTRGALAAIGAGLFYTTGFLFLAAVLLLVIGGPPTWPVLLLIAAILFFMLVSVRVASQPLCLPPYRTGPLLVVCAGLLALFAIEYLAISLLLGWLSASSRGSGVTNTAAGASLQIAAMFLALFTGASAFRVALDIRWGQAAILLLITWCITMVAGSVLGYAMLQAFPYMR
jgi:hypothetical protein